MVIAEADDGGGWRQERDGSQRDRIEGDARGHHAGLGPPLGRTGDPELEQDDQEPVEPEQEPPDRGREPEAAGRVDRQGGHPQEREPVGEREEREQHDEDPETESAGRVGWIARVVPAGQVIRSGVRDPGRVPVCVLGRLRPGLREPSECDDGVGPRPGCR